MTVYLFAQAIIGLFFIATGIYNLVYFNVQLKRLQQTIIPYPLIALLIALVLQVGGGICLLINQYPKTGAIAALIFMILATGFFMRFWQERKDKQKRNVMFLFFVEHLAVMAALLMIIVR